MEREEENGSGGDEGSEPTELARIVGWELGSSMRRIRGLMITHLDPFGTETEEGQEIKTGENFATMGHPGDKIRIPQVSNEVAANPYVLQATMAQFLPPAADETGSIAVLAGDETDEED